MFIFLFYYDFIISELVIDSVIYMVMMMMIMVKMKENANRVNTQN